MQDSEIVVKPRDVMPAGATTLPAPYYTGADYFDREMDAFFRGMWICAGRAEQVAAPGAFFLRDVVGESIIVTRDAVIRIRPTSATPHPTPRVRVVEATGK